MRAGLQSPYNVLDFLTDLSKPRLAQVNLGWSTQVS